LAVLIIANVIAALASLSQAVTGFGFALVLVPLLSFFFEPKLVVLVSLSLGLACKLPLLVHCWRDIQLTRMAILSAAAMVGAWFGTRILLTADPSVMRVAIGIVVILLSLPMLFEFVHPVRRERAATFVVGAISGVINGATSMGGPPVVLFGVNQSWPKEQFRATLLGYFAVINTWSMALLVASGDLGMEAIRLDATLLPGLAIGLLIGARAFDRIASGPFRKGVVMLVIATALVSLGQGLQKLIT
jgi:uncharacterized protein